jgi:hypothetical protein
MGIRISPFLEKESSYVREFNNRVRGSVGAFEFPETPRLEWLPPIEGRRIFQESFLEWEGGEVHGGYVLKRQDFSFAGAVEPIACYHSALSEGLAEIRYEDVAGYLIEDALQREPLLYAFEAGNIESARTRIPQTSAWKWSALPSYYRIVHPARYLRNMETLRTTGMRRFLLSLAALTGAGWAAMRLEQRMHANPKPAPAMVDFFDRFGPWVDELWTQCAKVYPFLAVRNAETLGILYPGGKFLRMKVSTGGKTVGWAVALDPQMQWDKRYGDMRLGSIVDCLALPEHALYVVSAARRVLERRGVDLVICGHSHPAWRSALSGAGFVEGPSDFAFGTAPELAAKIAAASAFDKLYLMRGDGNARALPEWGHAPL